MPKFFENKDLFNYTWDQVARGFWKRYPNPNSKHVLSEDTVIREVRSGKLFSKRILRKTNSIPKWAERFVTAKYVYIVEESIVDPKQKTLVTYTRNLGYAKVMSVIEKVVYKQCEEFPDKTVAVRNAWIDSQVRGFSRAICAFGYERFRKNVNKMFSGFNSVLATLYPAQNVLSTATVTVTAAAKLKDEARKAARSATELAKSKAAPIYASLHQNQS